MILYDTKYIQLKSAESKSGSDWVYAHRPNATDVVVILPIINNKQVLFLIENRPPIIAEKGNKQTIGFPAGLVGDERKGESVNEAILAELLEETGLVPDSVTVKARTVASSAGCLSETFTIVFAYIVNYKLQQNPIDDDGVIVDRVLVDIDNIRLWLKEKEREGLILTSQMLSALYYLTEEFNL